jgi:hypothetical protein
MGFVLFIVDISAPSGHEFDILNIPFFAFEFEVSIHGNVETVKKPRISRVISNSTNKRKKTYASTPAFSHPSGRFRPGCGHAGHSTINSPLDVALIPSGS